MFSGLDYVDNSGRAFHDPAVHLEGHPVPSCGELAGLAGGSERVLRHDSKALALCFVVPAPGPGTELADLGYRPAAEPVAGTTVFQRGSHCSAGQR